MRVIAGQHKGRPLASPKGSATRPTTDRVRESLFSALASARGGFDGAYVLDLFAGTGALGVEALSRGAAFACFCEKNRHALTALKSNTSFLAPGTFRIARIDVERTLPPRAEAPFDLLFLDPPYALAPVQVASLVQSLGDAGLIAPSACLSYEHDAGADLDEVQRLFSLQWNCLSQRRFGDTAISLFRASEPTE